MKTYAEKIGERRKIAEDTLRINLERESKRLALLLKNRGFKFDRIYLFGSTLKKKPLSPWSDIDMAIEGLAPEAFYKAYACLLKHSNFPIDFKPYEDIDETIKNRIKKEGKVLYERK